MKLGELLTTYGEDDQTLELLADIFGSSLFTGGTELIQEAADSGDESHRKVIGFAAELEAKVKALNKDERVTLFLAYLGAASQAEKFLPDLMEMAISLKEAFKR